MRSDGGGWAGSRGHHAAEKINHRIPPPLLTCAYLNSAKTKEDWVLPMALLKATSNEAPSPSSFARNSEYFAGRGVAGTAAAH